MKSTYLLVALLFWGYAGRIFSQNEERNLPPESFSINHPGLIKIEAFFQEKYFSKGISASELGEGTGYLPYLRAKRFYEMRKDFRGELNTSKRWEIFEKHRAASLGRDGNAPAADWKSLGPNKMEGQGGRMICHAFDPQNSQVIWAGSASGGLWLTENGGENWQPMTDQIPATGVGAVAINPLNSNTLLIGTGEGYGMDIDFNVPGLGVFRSTDRGLTWLPTDFDFLQNEGVSAFKIVWSHADTNTVWLASTNGIWKSTDAGQHWILKMGDGTNQQNFICSDILQHPTDAQKLFAAITWDGIYRSTDGGENWTKLTIGLPDDDLHFINLDLCRSQPNIILASIAGTQTSNFALKGLFRSTDGGDSWAKIQNAPNAFCIPFQPSICQGWYNNLVAVSPDDPNHIWLGGMTLWRTLDGGQNWTEHDRYKLPNSVEPPACLTYVDQHDFAFDPQNPQTVYAFNDGGVAKSIDGGTCFEFKNEGLVTAQFYTIASGRSDPGTVVGSTQDHGMQGVKLSENNNFSWDRWAFPEAGDVEVNASNANILYGNGFDGAYWRTNGGVHSHASQITNGINLAENNGFYIAKIRQKPAAPLTLLGATKVKLYKTTNGGALWSAKASIPGEKVFEFDQADPNFAYCAAWSFDGSRSFWRSEDGGDTWAQLPQNPGWRVTDLKSSPLQAGLIYVCRNSNLPNVAHIYKSTDNGDSWTAVQGDLPDLTVNAIACHHFVPGVLFAATDLGVFITTDDGVTWTEYNENMPVAIINDIQFNPADTSVLIGTYGRGAWRTKAWMPDVSATQNPTAARFGITKISPNPAGEMVHMDCFLEKTGDVWLDVLNVLGQKVATVFSGKLAAGEHHFLWNGLNNNGSRVDPGIYFLKMNAGGRATTVQLVWR